ncbi:hypothetical protein ILUMI_20706 [Ignelater luminosus]|uniref:Axonemal 84 kDa protein n=1 Tax=Ignelater luminosus TaxID=2038154 RepID=A0A8K0CGW0_IGNLU|nr:hypothetical protein ILUMI_20706 [Ignelater luminosus]
MGKKGGKGKKLEEVDDEATATDDADKEVSNKKKGKKGARSAKDVTNENESEAAGKKGKNKKSSTDIAGSQIGFGKKGKGKRSIEVWIDEASVAQSKKSKKSEAASAVAPQDVGGKKLSKKEKARLAAEMAEKARIQAELDAKQAEEEERMRLILEKKVGIEKEKREAAEQQLRTEQLGNSLNQINLIKKRHLKKALKDRDQLEWEQYLKCDGLPDPYVCGQLNTYLHLWEKVIESTTIDEAATRTPEALGLLEILTNLIDDPVGVETLLIENWKWVHRLFREYQQKSLDVASYRLLRDIQNNLYRLKLSTADFQRKEEHFALYLYVLVRLPTCMPNPRTPPPPRIQLDISDIQMYVLFPESIDGQLQAIRVMYVKYDHLSDLCATYHKPSIPEQYNLDLYQATLEEWYSKLYYKYENRIKPGKQQDGGKAKVEEQIVDRAAGIIPIVPFQKLEPSASTYVIYVEDQMYMETRVSLQATVEENVINLRKYIILGGTFYLNMFYQPPQPQGIVSYDMRIARLEVPKSIKRVPIYIDYELPSLLPMESKTKQQESEAEIEARRKEMALNKLILISVVLPDHVLWLHMPMVCQWDEENYQWTTGDIYDLKYNEEENCLTFRTGRFGCFALATYKYSNMPYQAWEIKPDADDTILFQITAAILLIEFKIKGDLICISQLQNLPNENLQSITGVYYKLPKLIRTLQESGIDIFPSADAFCYVEGTCEKHWPLEKHTYFNMAQLSICYNFAWSRWNKDVGRRSIVLQMREYKHGRAKQFPYKMLLVTPLKAAFIECNESSETYSEEIEEGMHFYSDLYNLSKGTSGMATKTKVQNASFDQLGAVAELLKATRVLSFC